MESANMEMYSAFASSYYLLFLNTSIIIHPLPNIRFIIFLFSCHNNMFLTTISIQCQMWIKLTSLNLTVLAWWIYHKYKIEYTSLQGKLVCSFEKGKNCVLTAHYGQRIVPLPPFLPRSNQFELCSEYFCQWFCIGNPVHSPLTPLYMFLCNSDIVNCKIVTEIMPSSQNWSVALFHLKCLNIHGFAAFVVFLNKFKAG